MPGPDVDEQREIYEAVLRGRRAQEAVDALGAGEDPRLRELRLHNAIVCATFSAGGTVIDALVAVCAERERLLGELVDLQDRVGRRYRLPSGNILVFRPPDAVLPIIDLSEGDILPPEVANHCQPGPMKGGG